MPRLLVQIRDEDNRCLDQFNVETEEGTDEQFASALRAVIETSWPAEEIEEEEPEDESEA